MTTPRYRQLQILTVAFGVLALFGLDAYAQTCSVGTRDKGTTTIKQMSVLQGEPPDASSPSSRSAHADAPSSFFLTAWLAARQRVANMAAA